MSQELALGKAAAQRMTQLLGGSYYDQELIDYLNRRGGELTQFSAQAELPYRIEVADRSEPGLYILPAGQIVVTRGLLSELQNDEEVTALLAHAIGHVEEGHFSERTLYSLSGAAHEFLKAAQSTREHPGAFDIQLAKMFEKHQYRSEEELAADLNAHNLLTRAGKSRDGMTTLLRRCLETPSSRMSLEGNHLCSDERQAALAQVSNSSPNNSAAQSLPAVLSRLKSLQAGYELLATAQALESAGEESESIAAYLQAATEAADEPLILGALGMAYLRAGQKQSARIHLQAAVELQPDYYRTRMGLGYLLLQQSRFLEARSSLQKSVQLLPVPENLYLLAECKESLGDIKGASMLYRRVVKADRRGKLGRAAASRLRELEGAK